MGSLAGDVLCKSLLAQDGESALCPDNRHPGCAADRDRLEGLTMFETRKIGSHFPPFTIPVERGKLRELALAIGDPNLVYQDQHAAQAAGYLDVPLPPTTATIFLFWGNAQFVEQLISLGLDVARVLHREENYEYLAPIYPGDVLTGSMTVRDGSTRTGPDGTTIDLVTLDIRYTNQHNQPVLIATTRLMSRQ
jgi:acyl dehydratase